MRFSGLDMDCGGCVSIQSLARAIDMSIGEFIQ